MKKIHPVLLKRQVFITEGIAPVATGNSYILQFLLRRLISGSMVENNKPLWYTHTHIYIYELVMKYQGWSIKTLSLNWCTGDDHFRTLTNLQNCLSGKVKGWSSTFLVIWLLVELKINRRKAYRDKNIWSIPINR